MASVITNLMLHSWPQSTATAPWLVIVSRPTEGRRLSWLLRVADYISYQDGTPANSHTYLSTNRVWRRVASLTWPVLLPIGQTNMIKNWALLP